MKNEKIKFPYTKSSWENAEAALSNHLAATGHTGLTRNSKAYKVLHKMLPKASLEDIRNIQEGGLGENVKYGSEKFDHKKYWGVGKNPAIAKIEKSISGSYDKKYNEKATDKAYDNHYLYKEGKTAAQHTKDQKAEVKRIDKTSVFVQMTGGRVNQYTVKDIDKLKKDMAKEEKLANKGDKNAKRLLAGQQKSLNQLEKKKQNLERNSSVLRKSQSSSKGTNKISSKDKNNLKKKNEKGNKNNDDGRWITVNGRKIFIPKGKKGKVNYKTGKFEEA